MEAKAYLEIIKKRWRIAVLGLVATIVFTLAFALSQDPVYESSGTYVVRPTSTGTEETVRAIDTLVRGVEINSTFATIATSNLIESRAKDTLDPAINTSGLDTSAQVIAGTNVLELSVSGPDPDAVHALTVAVGQETVNYIAGLDETFELAPLDSPRVPTKPLGPNTSVMIATGIFLGALLGAALAIAAEALGGGDQGSAPKEQGADRDEPEPPVEVPAVEVDEPEADLEVLDVPEAGFEVLDDHDFSSLFRRELSRARRRQSSLTVGLLAATGESPRGADSGNGVSADIEQLARSSMPAYRREGRIVSLGDARFAVIESNASAEEAEGLLMAWLTVWKAAIELSSSGLGYNNGSAPRISIGVSTYSGAEDVDAPGIVTPGNATPERAG